TLVYVTNGGVAEIPIEATGGAGLEFLWSGPCGPLTSGSPDPCGGSTIVTISSTGTLILTNVQSFDAGAYNVNVVDQNTAQSPPATQLIVLTTPPQFAPGGAITGLGTDSPALNLSGQAGTPFSVWASTNLDLRPIESTWTLVWQGTFSGGADTVPLTPTETNEFYIITQP
ncbi:MAG TPA: hypothetical protein VGN61_05735, partial [Verrucomicrobiae bacterium]